MLGIQDIIDHATLPAQAKEVGTDILLDLTMSPRLDSGTEREILLDQDDLLEHAILLHQAGQLQVAEKVYTVLLQVRTKGVHRATILTAGPCILNMIHELPLQYSSSLCIYMTFRQIWCPSVVRRACAVHYPTRRMISRRRVARDSGRVIERAGKPRACGCIAPTRNRAV